MKELYENYEKLRDERNLSDFKVAQDIGISRSTLSEWRQDLHQPSLQNLAKLAKYFEVPIEYFLDEGKA